MVTDVLAFTLIETVVPLPPQLVALASLVEDALKESVPAV